MSSWLERNWDLFKVSVGAGAAEGDETEPDYLYNDIGPLLYAINPERDQTVE